MNFSRNGIKRKLIKKVVYEESEFVQVQWVQIPGLRIGLRRNFVSF